MVDYLFIYKIWHYLFIYSLTHLHAFKSTPHRQQPSTPAIQPPTLRITTPDIYHLISLPLFSNLKTHSRQPRHNHLHQQQYCTINQ